MRAAGLPRHLPPGHRNAIARAPSLIRVQTWCKRGGLACQLTSARIRSGISATLARHAEMLTGAGIDFIVADSTNAQSTGAMADALQLRPWEVVAEEWLALRKQGTPTPKIAIWCA